MGPWGHRISNFAVDGTPHYTGFLDFYTALGGLQAFGLPKSDARLDDHPGAVLAIEGADPGIIRQYFQAAVFEYRPGRLQPVQLRFLGDAVRDRLYPYSSYRVFASFQAAEPLSDDETYAPERVSTWDALVMLYGATNGDHDAYVAGQRDALVALYHATNGADWNKSDHWLSDAPLGEWYGVTTDDHDRVVELNLSQNQLSGTLPPEIGKLAGPHEFGCLRQPAAWGDPARDRQPRQPDPPRALGQSVSRVDPRRNGRHGELGVGRAWHQRVDRPDSARVGQALECHPSGLHFEPAERRDPVRVGQPDQPGLAGLLEQRAERPDSTRVGQPDQPGTARP